MVRHLHFVAVCLFAVQMGCGSSGIEERLALRRSIPEKTTCSVLGLGWGGQWQDDLPDELNQRGRELVIRLLEDDRVRKTTRGKFKIIAEWTGADGSPTEVHVGILGANEYTEIVNLGPYTMPTDLFQEFRRFFKDAAAHWKPSKAS